MVNNLGTKINKLRTNKGLTLEELAKRIDSDKSYVWSIENGRIKQPSAEMIDKIAKALGVIADDLLGKMPKTEEAERSRLYRNFQNLSEKDQKTIKEMIKRFQMSDN